ncbi:DEAD/DEAH box helicase [Granulicatella seriolae]|uniref:DEAD/DEAH box helicase n=1 Tax=Granulicatella seriolae TaxID=2967226 RepID=A0ABT1WLT9_9LACT|nr:DEAD/DEAH box helicase [Granulicatella seriolae]
MTEIRENTFKTTAFEQHWQDKGFTETTPIQAATFAPLQAGEDLVGISPTGTGKTLAYLLPLLDKVEAIPELQVMILAPSQELAQQIGQVASEWAALKDLRVQVIIGGANQKRQLEQLKQKPQILVGTTGRILELGKTKKIKFHQIRTVVLDEADHLLQVDQLSTTRELIKKCPSQRQLAFFSATENEPLKDINKWFNTAAKWFDMTEEAKRSIGNVKHTYLVGPVRKRDDLLRRLAHVDGMQALVFVNAIADAAILADKLDYHHIPVALLHSQANKEQRRQALNDFKTGKVTYLLTTDLASRGLDLEDLPAVIQFDLPESKEVYTHRAGRTGRMGKSGLVLSLIGERDARDLRKLLPDGASLKEVFVYGGSLVEELPKDAKINSLKTKSSKRPDSGKKQVQAKSSRKSSRPSPRNSKRKGSNR